MGELIHKLNSACYPDCSMGFLHTETRLIMDAYPFLNIESSHSYELTQDYIESFNNSIDKSKYDLSEGFGGAKLEIDKMSREYGSQVSKMDKEIIINSNINKIIPFFFEYAGVEMTNKDLSRIINWNKMVMDDLTFHPSDGLPIMPIQVFWTMRYPGQAYDYSEYSIFLSKEHYCLESILGSQGIPPKLLLAYCYHENLNVRVKASQNPSCPPEGKVVVALGNGSR